MNRSREDRYTLILSDLRHRLKLADEKHGDWRDYNSIQIMKAVMDEVIEYDIAFEQNQIIGPHGQIAELMDIATVAIKGALRLADIAEMKKQEEA